jgi:hypothetical protein
MKRNVKIARLPHDIREQLNRRLQDNEPGDKLLEWLNGQQAVQKVLRDGFAGAAITKQNLSEWRTGGFASWVLGQELVYEAQDTDEGARRLDAVTDSSLPDRLATVLAGRYASLLARWDGEVTEAFTKKLRALGSLCRDICALRRSHHDAIKAKIAMERHAERHEGNARGKGAGNSAASGSVAPGQSELGCEARGSGCVAGDVAKSCRHPEASSGEGESDSVRPGQTTLPPKSGTDIPAEVATGCRQPEPVCKPVPKPTESYLNMLLAASRAKILPVQPPIAPFPDWDEEGVVN